MYVDEPRNSLVFISFFQFLKDKIRSHSLLVTLYSRPLFNSNMCTQNKRPSFTERPRGAERRFEK